MWGWLLSLLALVALGGSSARAEQDPRARPSSAEARAHLVSGNRLFRSRELGKAIAEYKAGAVIEDVPLFHFNLGQAYRMAGRDTEAVWYYELFLEHVPEGYPGRAALEAVIAQARARLASAAKPGAAKPGAAIARRTATPAALRPAKGSGAKEPGIKATVAKETGELVIMIKPWAAIWVNGKSQEGGTPHRMKLPVGRHRLRLANEDLDKRETLTVTIKANQATVVERTW